MEIVMRRVTIVPSLQESNEGKAKIWYFSSTDKYMRVWDNSANWRVEQFDSNGWKQLERIDRGITHSPSITDVMYTRHRVRADIWNFQTESYFEPYLIVALMPSGKGYAAWAKLRLQSAYFTAQYNGDVQVVIEEVCSTAQSCLDKWKSSWKDYCREGNFTSQFNWDRTLHPQWYKVSEH